MGNQVYANGREVSCKAAAGKAIAAFPDTCFTPPQTPATPPGVPIPYPNTGMASDSDQGSKTVQISGQEVMLKDQSCFKKSSGDEAGSAPKKGLITSQITGKVYFTAWSMDVKFEGENVVRHLDLMTHNHASAPGNTPPWVYSDEQAQEPIEQCKKDVEKKETACGGKETREEQCADDACNAAKKCLLVTYQQGSRDSSSTQVGCCDDEQPHHIIEAHGFCEDGERGTPLDEFKDYKIKEAPCVCAKGDRWEQEHGAFHALVGQKENAAVAKAAAAKKERAWNYGDAKAAGLNAHKKIFPDSKCNPDCLEAQVDAYHKEEVDVNNRTPLRTGTQGLQDWQKQSAKKVIETMQDQIGEAAEAGD
ncbi:MAG TPA: PAAR-like domain-containing protein [Stellaceae bacterium]|nr:PAAR-like domain-containing protein [Stellaceae bacterium]